MSNNTELRIEYVPLSELQRAPRNPKSHDHDGIERSMSRFGYVAPIIINDGTGRIVAGHGRLETLDRDKKAGKPAPARIKVRDDGEWLVAVLRGVSFQSDEEAEAYLIADNRLQEKGGWLDAQLAQMLNDIKGAGYLEATGFTAIDLDKLIAQLPAKSGPLDLDVEAANATSRAPSLDALGGEETDHADEPKTGYVKQVQLFYNQEQHAEFMRLTGELSQRYGTENITDTVLEAIRRAHNSAQ
jgi:hypothetical protein